MSRKHHIETNLVQIGNNQDEKTGAVSAPVYFSTAYRHAGIGQSTGYDYSRTKNPTRDILENAIASLENGRQGFALSSGMAAIQTLFAIFESGEEILASQDLYGGTYRLFEEGWKHWGVSINYGDPRDIEQFEQQVTEKTRALFIETPTNPLMQQADLYALSDIARKHNLLLIVDNTFYTPILQKPLDMGADIVIHSASKYLGGHNDVIAGLIVAKDESICERIAAFHNGMGTILAPLDSWLLMRGMKTLSLRMEKHTENAKAVAAYLEDHDKIADVLYPGKGGMLSFRVKDEEWVDTLLQELRLITFAESLGGVESFITYPATQTHADVPEEVRMANGVDNRLLRFSVGIEHAEDLIADLDQAFSKL
ncbi:cysteine synthase /cystathionine gamma-synthase [Alteribacillus persepolensis]|uniref:Cysteine synthase /cystathionine gamma-synthase n=1 Tax=Alteribacillus persepolensis TaxID=568899 RepID=A0A1G7ZI20_9BACI|nr:methionine biosynthesis PLP-dependent protein [Alteribacillus persepolensis]SDH08421.1 cysteine synthase /cystathionine gamma-synthase [Alteribacillus persepolensis]